MNQFTRKQLRQWRLFEDFRQTGMYNMAHPNMQVLMTVSKEEHLFIIKHYAELKVAYEEEEDNHYHNLHQQMLGDDRYQTQP